MKIALIIAGVVLVLGVGVLALGEPSVEPVSEPEQTEEVEEIVEEEKKPEPRVGNVIPPEPLPVTEEPQETKEEIEEETPAQPAETVQEASEPEPTSGVEYEDENVKIWTDGNYRYIESNAIPNHETGSFPNSGNPNTISEQDLSYRVTLNPVKNSSPTNVPTPGVGLNGIPFEPGTAEREGDLNIEALQDTYNLGLDYSNAHVQPTGLYHYHGVPEGYIGTVPEDADLVQVGWAADGFPMYVSQAGMYKPSWQLISGKDGTYTQDFELIQGSGDLDECNGMTLESGYVYFLTDEFPYISRCLFGTPDDSFAKDPNSAPPGGGGQQGPPSGGPGGQGGPPPRP